MNLIDELLAEVTPQEQQRVHTRMMLAARIADALSAKGWTQKQLANRMGRNPSEASKWLSGTHNFTTDTLADLSSILDVKLLCVKEEEPTVITVVKYQPILISANALRQGSKPVMLGNFMMPYYTKQSDSHCSV